MREDFQQVILESNKLAFAGRTDDALGFVVQSLENGQEKLAADPKQFLFLFHHCLRIQSTDPRHSDSDKHLQILKFGANIPEIAPLIEFADDYYCGRITATEAVSHNFAPEHRFETFAFYQQIIGECHQKAGQFFKAIQSFELAIELDPYWYPAYLNLSDCNLKLGLQKKSDHYFFLYEDANPFGMHGNFESHANLLEELLFQKRFSDATYTIEALSDWWLDSRGFIPTEISVFNNLSLARVAEAEGNAKTQKEYKSLAVQEANQAIADEKIPVKTLYFVGKMLLEHDLNDKYFEVLREVLTNPMRRVEETDLIQKVGADFVGMKKLERPIKVIRDALTCRPENQDLQFCLLVLKLKQNNIQPEEYLLKKEQLRVLSHKGNSEVEQLQLLHSLDDAFDEDADVVRRLAALYRAMGSSVKASSYYKRLLMLNPKSTKYRLDYVDFLLDEGELATAQNEVDQLNTKHLEASSQAQVQWFKVRLNLLQNSFDEASRNTAPLVESEPWNVRYLVAEIMAKSALRNIAYEKELLQIAESGQEEVQWEDFEQETNMLLENHQYEIAYLRSKLKFIKSKGNATELQRVTAIAQNFMQKRCIAELVKLLNTNFHSGQIYWSIAKLYKSMWMLESSTEWFELAMKEGLDRQAKASCFVEIADNQIWQKQEYQKAIELVKTAIELSGKKTPKALATLAYAFLLKGETVNARRAISGLDLRASYDATFVAGLIEYRDGLTSKAKEIWKPIITAKSDDLRVHVLKKQVREFYYEGSPLWKQSAS